MLKMFILVISLFGLLGSAVGQIIQTGLCDEDIELQGNFTYESILGDWYEVYTSEPTRECSTYQFNDGNFVIRYGVNSNFDEILNGTVSLENDTAQAQLSINWESSGIENYWVVEHYEEIQSLLYRCENIGANQRRLSFWVLSRDPSFTTQQQFLTNTTLQRFGIYLQDLREVSRSDDSCYILPIIEPGNPIILPGSCNDDISVVQNFNVSRFTGLWHEVASYFSPNSGNQCARAEYTLDGDVVNVVNSEVINQTLYEIRGTAVVASDDNSARLRVTLLVDNVPVEQDLWILATDYDNFAISYSCIDIPSADTTNKQVFSWILGRRRVLSESAQEAVNEAIASEVVLNDFYYQEADQSDEGCFYLPEPVPDQPVVFRGSCNASIPVVQNFNASGYMGLWHDIASYPSVFQTGTCRNAYYELSSVVDVLNTQVLDRTLDTIRGTAVPSEDGSAKLEVTFPVAGLNVSVTTDYWVLATDYETYALVYSCVDIPEREDKQVWAWKLSRTQELSINATNAINSVIADVPELNDMYFVDVNQTRDGCFYFPEPQPGQVVVFPGQCEEDDIDVVQNFNLTAFSGIWHEVQAYPKDEQQGGCVNHDYTIGADNTLNLQSSQIVDQFLGFSNATLTFASASDNSARLTITLDSGIVIPFYIVAIDYEDYALAYSCVNRDDRFRAVYSWKLSREKTLSADGSVAIDNAMSNVDILDNVYFEEVDQTDEACFYLPNLDAGEPIILFGQCDENITVIENFNASRFLERWFLIESYPSDFQFGQCSDATYTLNTDGTVNVVNTEVINQTLATVEGLATILPDGTLNVTFPGALEPSQYIVLDTDYDTYALVYSCQNLDNEQRRVWSWKLSRSRSLTPQAEEAINARIDTINVLNNRYYQPINHTDEDCFYFPDPEPGTPVRFRGRCDQNIQVVENFNLTRYLGLWHNIELYPSVFQGGSCINARYTLGDGVVDVFNTQVLDQTLDSINGEATAASDGSARLNVTFPIAGTNLTVTTNYWVLATDYDTYALVYTCEEIDDEYKYVYSWKLSRTRELSPDAEASILNVTSNIQVLDDMYYNVVDQSDNGCFYIPEVEPGQPIVFPGRCDEDINVVQNFSLDQFQGIWHEIEAYPKEQQQGQCVNHEYTLGQGSEAILNLQSTQVSNLSLGINNGVLSFNSTDGSARMVIDITVNGEAINIPFYILETDYVDYALAYSCINLEDEDVDRRAVYSWKLSRNRTLSTDAIGNIASIINSTDVLVEDFYDPINQTDDACFYLPEFVPGEPVVFRGQCDENISGVANFNLTRYLDLWRSVQSYPSEFQGGSCIQATYIAGDDEVIVYNTQVLNQTLDSLNGTATLGDRDGLLLVNFPTTPEVARYYVLATDYDSYALVYSCRNIAGTDNDPFGRRQVWAWKLSRERELSPADNNAINAVVENINVLNNQYFEDIPQSQEACFYYPEADGQPVTFRGQCSDNITVVQNFNVTGYMGTWYDLESFPQMFQDGSCPTATYTLNDDGVVEVYNTQVVDQELDEIRATAVLAGDDGLGILNVTFPVAGTNFTITVPYYILATDYDNYALVYSCQDISDDRYRVTSWKLSRQQQFTNGSLIALAEAQSNVKELLDTYYVERDHSEDGCFYYPDNNGGPVILDGQCEDTDDVQVVTDFDSVAFNGTWYEIERFPSELQNGACVRNDFVSNQNGFAFQKTIIYGDRLNTFNGEITLANSSRGVLTVSLTNGSSTITGYLFVLDVDYNDYVLLYSCRDIDSESKQVYSWKLSRQQSGLSVNASSNIDTIVTDRRDLAQKYYEATGQDSDACFYYPVFPERPSSIILPGSCDTIRGVAEFNVTSYLGRWFEVSSYPVPNVVGECVRANYAPGTAGVTITNTQVVNRTLVSQSGEIVSAAEDGSGLVTVNFTVDGETRTVSYYILATDYENYALVHNCRNLEDGNREVFSWIHSRTSTLSNDANTAINNMIENTRELLPEYYEPTSQSHEDCFYVPELVANQPLHFRGRCENITSGLFENFDSQRYLRRWHEVSRYPSNVNGGNCVSTTYEALGNTIVFEGLRVFGTSDGRVTQGTATMESNGRIVRTYTDGSTETLWVVATDYDSYSLLLSCEDVDDDEYMRVWSAQHSTTRTLSTAAQTALAPVIEGNDLLYNNFFSNVNQDDDSCFYYPVQDGQSVILPGQCDANIPTQSNFDLAAYTGTWYQIERYPYPQVRNNSTCIGTRYTLQGQEDTVNVLNWEINDGDLETVEGVATLVEDSAILRVELRNDPENPEEVTATADLYILSTDYTSYSLVYTCQNIDQYSRVVVAIKLSRTRSLPTSAQQAINTMMATRPELHQPYFIEVEHNDECEDPSSSFLVKSSIIVTLICLIIQTLM